MPDRHWGLYTAIGVSAALLAFGALKSLESLGAYRLEHLDERRDVARTDDDETRKEVERRCGSPPSTEKCVYEVEDTKQGQKHERTDLKAQQDTAEWTFASFLVNLAGVFISAGGLWALVFTFYEQRKLTQNEARAVLEVLGATIQYSSYRAYGTTEENISVAIHIKNSGQTSAFKVQGKFGFTYSPRLIEGDPVEGQEPITRAMPASGANTIASQDGFVLRSGFSPGAWVRYLTETGSDGWIGTELCEPVTLVVFGVVEYEDIFQKTRFEAVRFTINHLKMGETHIMWGSTSRFWDEQEKKREEEQAARKGPPKE